MSKAGPRLFTGVRIGGGGDPCFARLAIALRLAAEFTSGAGLFF
ncbi:MAG TPA: hypothetical protein PLN52_19355 [Opitutaceae bacterium]|nr:hypothetical protein [Opitutaceae bacterium]